MFNVLVRELLAFILSSAAIYVLHCMQANGISTGTTQGLGGLTH